MPESDPPRPRPHAFQEAEVVSITDAPPLSQPLVVRDPSQTVRHDPELDRQRSEQRHELEKERLRLEYDERIHARKKEIIDRVFGHIMRFTVVAGGIALFPLHYPVVGGLLLGAGLDLLTRSELRSILKGAIKGVDKKEDE